MTRISDAHGPFNPEVQEAVGTAVAPAPEQSGDIAEVVRNGYRIDDRILRPQQVRVYVDR